MLIFRQPLSLFLSDCVNHCIRLYSKVFYRPNAARMTLDDQKQQFSFAYVRAIAAVAKISVAEPEVDDDSVDLSLKMKTIGGIIRSPQLDVQVKCSERVTVSDGLISFPLKIKNYEELRPTNILVPRILVVVTVSEHLSEWLGHSETELAMRKCGYWTSLRGLPDTDNTSTVTVELLRTNAFSVLQLQSIMERIRNGGMP